jgi:hypothetical protein
MHTVELLEHALAAAGRLGIKIRQEWLGGSGGGDCEIKGQQWIFLDLAESPVEQLNQVISALQNDPRLVNLSLPYELRDLLGVRKIA